jgi:phosphoribosylformylglycinamidine synthase
VADRKLIAYHDRSDGGLFVTLTEMAFAGHCGLDIQLDRVGGDLLPALFNEELGAVIQVRREDKEAVLTLLAGHGLAACSHVLGTVREDDLILFQRAGSEVYRASRTALRTIWGETSWQMQRLRDNPSARIRSMPPARTPPIRVCRPGSPTTRPTTWPRPISLAGFLPVWRCCASRGSTPTWRWRPPSTAPALPLSTCT